MRGTSPLSASSPTTRRAVISISGSGHPALMVVAEGVTRLMLTDNDCTGSINLGNNSEFTVWDSGKSHALH
jgi:hypothetical protein